jgi:predicted methyltransferase
MLRIFIPATLLMLIGCTRTEAPNAEAPLADAAPVVLQDALTASVNGEWRSEQDRARDAFRHPEESLRFWGLAPGMTILEMDPGGGWWTEILAPFAHATGGQYHAAGADPDFPSRFATRPEIYGTVTVVNAGDESAPLPRESFDFILTARSIHGWIGDGMAAQRFEDMFGALKPGGILAVEQHRANPGSQDPKAASGYVTEAQVIELAQNAGFELGGRSEINANAKDTKDHPFGVWTLPPTNRSRPYGEGPEAIDPTFDRAKYEAIGESDRMTLKFIKPNAAG